ncbi:MAG: helix-turn-helix domain-containing protein [Candidatus Woesearchaeota archaeon]|jgi:sugar-specific transcriptional regulator TrmB
MDAQTLETLQKIGLTDAESKVYVILLELGASQAAEITKKTNLHRRTVYDAIERLIGKGLISYIKENNIKKYKAVDPKNLEKVLQEQEKMLKEIMPRLELLKNLEKEKEETSFFRGKEGLKSIFNHQLEIGKEICIIGASESANEILKYYFPHFDQERKERKIPVRILFAESARTNKEIKKIPLAKIKFLPKEFEGPAATNVYGDCISIILWTKDNPIAIKIEHKEIARAYKNQFELLWSIAKK